MNGTGLGSLSLLDPDDFAPLSLHNEAWICNFERMKKGLMLRCTNSKKWYIIPLAFRKIDCVSIRQNEIEVSLQGDQPSTCCSMTGLIGKSSSNSVISMKSLLNWRNSPSRSIPVQRKPGIAGKS